MASSLTMFPLVILQAGLDNTVSTDVMIQKQDWVANIQCHGGFQFILTDLVLHLCDHGVCFLSSRLLGSL